MNADLNPIRTVGDLRALIFACEDDLPVRIHFGWDLAIAESGFDEDDGAVIFFADADAGVSAVSSSWAREQGLNDA